MIGLSHYLIVSCVVFTLGILGILLNRRNLIAILLSIELMFLSVNINMVAFSYFLNDLRGQAFSLFVLTIAAAESAIGLAILMTYFRNRSTIHVDDLSQMKG